MIINSKVAKISSPDMKNYFIWLTSEQVSKTISSTFRKVKLKLKIVSFIIASTLAMNKNKRKNGLTIKNITTYTNIDWLSKPSYLSIIYKTFSLK